MKTCHQCQHPLRFRAFLGWLGSHGKDLCCARCHWQWMHATYIWWVWITLAALYFVSAAIVSYIETLIQVGVLTRIVLFVIALLVTANIVLTLWFAALPIANDQHKTD